MHDFSKKIGSAALGTQNTARTITSNYDKDIKFTSTTNFNSNIMMLNSTKDQTMSAEYKMSLITSFKNFRGLKKVENIKERYKIGQVLGEGSFGQVRIAIHR